jgi:methyl-accepting chemotaxis protein
MGSPGGGKSDDLSGDFRLILEALKNLHATTEENKRELVATADAMQKAQTVVEQVREALRQFKTATTQRLDELQKCVEELRQSVGSVERAQHEWGNVARQVEELKKAAAELVLDEFDADAPRSKKLDQ